MVRHYTRTKEELVELTRRVRNMKLMGYGYRQIAERFGISEPYVVYLLRPEAYKKRKRERQKLRRKEGVE